jgi:hypothetical protein
MRLIFEELRISFLFLKQHHLYNLICYYIENITGTRIDCRNSAIDYGFRYDLLTERIRKGICSVSVNDLVRSIANWSHRMWSILTTKGVYIK